MSHTYKNLYPIIYDFESLYLAYQRARKGKGWRNEILTFKSNLEENLIHIQNELIWKTYQSGSYRHFKIHEPKERDVAALPFRDRVVHHALVDAIQPVFESRFIHHSYACRAGKGTHAGADAAQRMMRIVKRNHGRVYALKADISKYFASIDHDVLLRLIEKRIACQDTLWLIKSILSTTSSPGIPLGNLTSQLFANIYLDALDQFVKHDLKAQHYARYMDDFVILHHNKTQLHLWLDEIQAFLSKELKLKTNHKTQIFPVHHKSGRGLDFLGYRILPTHRKLRKDSVKRFKTRLKRMQKQYKNGDIDLHQVRQQITSWLAHARHANSIETITKILSKASFIKHQQKTIK
ncbi:MAG: hypothetical protein JXR47_05240 [Thiotrichales bacterium]|nr:hypothetical protein [Thiotrichales bacterium]